MEKEKRINMLCFAVAVVTVAVLVYFGFRNLHAEMTESYHVVALGDSILGKARGEENIQVFFEEASGLTMYNGAFGGNSASAGDEDYRYSFHERSLNLWMLAEAICRKDFGIQFAELAASQVKVWYFEEVMEGLARIDFEKVDFLLIEFGANDYAFGRKLDNVDDAYDVYTYGGALRYSIKMLQETYPDMRIVLITPAPNTVAATESGTLEEYVNLEKEIAEQYQVDVIDVYNEIGFAGQDISLYLEDDLHLNEAGRRIYGAFLGQKVRELALQSGETA